MLGHRSSQVKDIEKEHERRSFPVCCARTSIFQLSASIYGRTREKDKIVSRTDNLPKCVFLFGSWSLDRARSWLSDVQDRVFVVGDRCVGSASNELPWWLFSLRSARLVSDVSKYHSLCNGIRGYGSKRSCHQQQRNPTAEPGQN